MDYIESVLLVECAPLGTIIDNIFMIENLDSPFMDDYPLKIIDQSEDLIGVCLNINDLDDRLDGYLDHLEQLDLFVTLDEVVEMITFYKDNAFEGFSDIKILTANGLVGLIFRTTN